MRAKPISWVTTIIDMPPVARSAINAEHALDQFRVQRRGRLVEEHDLGLHGQGARDRDALLLTAG